ncbi:MAG: decaprenyl-phosphate phosphoribosyltransferase [Chloroflexota bacterium]|nr:decaprenyl-phosphate phosphoribosyltransferase [Chloroflexota bacterium]MDE2857599.1 decaprenyl-phosphate phosphoribosyltransferase [Chloroflexota bacterium]
MSTVRALIRSMRPQQWTKNILFVFPAIVFDAKLLEFDLLLRVIAVAGLLVLASGSVYIINDLMDRDQDRAHPNKRHRPIASGALSAAVAKLASVILALVSLGLAYSLDFELFLLLALYLLIQLAYSLRLKHIALLDVLIVAAGFVIRVMVGGVVIDVEVSPWLYAFTGLLAMFLVVGKRRQELVMLGDQAEDTRLTFRQYNLPLLDDMLRIVTTSTLITYILYTIEVETMTKHGANWGLITVPFVLYGLLRYLYLLHVEETASAPEEILLSDRPIQITVMLSGIAYFIILYAL